MDRFQDTVNDVLKLQVDNFMETLSRILIDSSYKVSRAISESSMKMHFHSKDYEANLKILPCFVNLY